MNLSIDSGLVEMFDSFPFFLGLIGHIATVGWGFKLTRVRRQSRNSFNFRGNVHVLNLACFLRGIKLIGYNVPKPLSLPVFQGEESKIIVNVFSYSA